MTERLLQFIWQFQYFQKNALATTGNVPVSIIHTGIHNSNQGPDFLNAKVKIGDTTWAGNIELHLKSSGWQAHGHDADEHYNNVILHVVFEDDRPDLDGIPVLELQSRISKILLNRYAALMNATQFIPCGNAIQTIHAITWQSWKERLLAERLSRKAAQVQQVLQQTGNHWEATFWRMLARHFGMKINNDAFEQVAMSIPVNLLAKHKHQVQQLEALLLGQAGLLRDHFTEQYPSMLQKEYAFLQHKYHLQPVHTSPLFLRMRPGNFPTIRLAQLAMLVHVSAHLFSRIREAEDIKDIQEWMDVTANDYWHYHYRFDQPAAYKVKKTGKQMIDHIIINTIVPVLFAYGQSQGMQAYKDKALRWLEKINGESNTITKQFRQLGITGKSAFDTQAMIELYAAYCQQKHCLNCAIGNVLLKQDK